MGFPLHKPYQYSFYRWSFLHFRRLKWFGEAAIEKHQMVFWKYCSLKNWGSSTLDLLEPHLLQYDDPWWCQWESEAEVLQESLRNPYAKRCREWHVLAQKGTNVTCIPMDQTWSIVTPYKEEYRAKRGPRPGKRYQTFKTRYGFLKRYINLKTQIDHTFTICWTFLEFLRWISGYSFNRNWGVGWGPFSDCHVKT